MNVALLSRMMTTFVQRNAYNLRYSDVAFVGINQVRDKLKAYIPTFETPGGHAWKHILSVRIQLSKAEDITEGSEKVGIYTRFVIKKNKLAPPFRTSMTPIIFGKGIDTLRDVLDFSTMLGIVEKAGSFYRFEGENLGQGLIKSMEYLEGNKEVLDKIVKTCYNILNTQNMEITVDKESEEENVEEIGS
jgi:recombination protein RecA